jgi:hypothetical protein
MLHSVPVNTCDRHEDHALQAAINGGIFGALIAIALPVRGYGAKGNPGEDSH